jgi:hypothetical protein
VRRPLCSCLVAGLVIAGQTGLAVGEPRLSVGAAEVVARALGEAVAAQEAEAAAALCAVPTNLDGEVVRDEAALAAAWRRAVERRALRGVRLVSVEVMPLEAATGRFGPPPHRLGSLPEGSLVAVIRLDRTQLVAVIAPLDDRWAVVAVTD